MTSEERQHFMSQEFRRIFGGEPAVWPARRAAWT